MKTLRDTYSDAFKGLMILSVINIHTVYWSLKPHTPDIIRQLAYLIDIPIFFFISGYFTRHSALISTSRQVIRQLVRLYLRYLAICVLVAVAVFSWVYFARDRVVEGLVPSLLSIFSLQLNGELWGYFKGYYGNLWYVHTYLPMLLLVPFMIGFPSFARMKYVVLIFLFLLYLLMTYRYEGHEFLLRAWGDILFYSLFFVLGTAYRIEEKSIAARQILFSLVLTCLLACLIFYLDNNELRLSAYKFPPSMQWLVYSLPLVHVFALIRPYWNTVLRPRITRIATILEWIGRNSFTVYLIQGFVCSIPFLFADKLSTAISSTILLYGIVYAFNVILSVLLSRLYQLSGDSVGRTVKRICADLPAVAKTQSFTAVMRHD